MNVRNDWTRDEVQEIFFKPLLELMYEAATVHRENNAYREVQVSSLISIKTGGCPEDCAYCPQAARYQTGVEVHALMPEEKVLELARKAKASGASRICMGASWREVRDNRDFDRVLNIVSSVNELGVEVCCTLGMLTQSQAERLKEAGCFAYNHNLDSSESYYDKIITTRTYEDRLKTLEHVRGAKLTVCSGGIIGLGESDEDRIGMLHTLATLPEHPESVPINALVAIKGTPLQDQKRVGFDEMVRMVATARILMPKTVVRLSAGRNEMSVAEQALCFMAGANSIFAGDKLLTTPNPNFNEDMKMFEVLGLYPRQPFKEKKSSSYTETLEA
jgi:biotin synthase